MRIAPLILACFLVISGTAYAEQRLTPSLDTRITKAVYQEDDVFPVYALRGHATMITFQEGESVVSWASGYSTAWEFATVKNHLLLKPKAKEGTTNLVVLTNKRSYHFDLQLGLKHQPVTYELRFLYPEEKRQVALVKLASGRNGALTAHNGTDKEDLFRSPSSNRQYTMNFGGASHSRQIAPEMAFDDGRFTYLKFPETAEFPAAYRVEGDEEALVNSHVEGSWLVIHGIYPELRLRNGQKVCGIYNEKFNSQD